MNHELLKEMLLLFIRENDRRVHSVVVAAEGGDESSLRDKVHAVKGSAALIGAEHLRELASDFEVRILSGTIRNARASADQLKDEYDAVVATLQSLYPDLGAN